MTTSAATIACTLDNEALSDRGLLFRQRIQPHALEERWLDNGLQLEFPNEPDLLEEIRTFIDLERACCGFLEFDLAEDEGGSRQILTVTGPQGTRAFLRRMQATAGKSETSPQFSDGVLKRSGLASITAGAACLLVCELPVILTIFGMTGMATALAFLQPGPIIEAVASALIFLGTIAVIVWHWRARQSRSSR